MWSAMINLLIPLYLIFAVTAEAAAADLEVSPFRTFNQSPLVQIYGLPLDTGADIAGAGRLILAMQHDLSSNFTEYAGDREQITLDGETYRLALSARYGFKGGWEAGIEIPYLVQGGGFLDSFIVDWHSAFNLPQVGRDVAPKDRINYSYSRDGVQKLKLASSGSGVGDIRLTGGLTLLDRRNDASQERIALKGTLKLPTGDSAHLRGSGATDMALLLCGSMDNFSEWGALGVFGSLGGLVMSGSDVLRDQHNPVVGAGSFGLGWSPASWISFKAQLSGHTPFYKGSSLVELSKSTLLLVFGGALMIPGEYILDIGISEDLTVATAPDVSFHLGISKRF